MDDSIPLKLCNKCLQMFPATSEFFVTGKKHHNGLRPLCKECRRMIRKDRKSPPVPRGSKRCSCCKQIYPATLEFFGYRSRSKDRLYEYCKECTAAKLEEKRNAPLPSDKPEHIACTQCQKVKPFTPEFFYRSQTARYKLTLICQDCYAANGKRFNQEHRTEKAAYAREWHIRNRQHNREVQNQWRANHREHMREVQRRRRKANPEREKAKKQRYRQTEHGRIKSRVYSRNRKAFKKGAKGAFTATDVKRMYKAQKGRCYYCKVKFGTGKNAYHVDHVIPVRRGGTNDPSNLVLACPTCNQRKHSKLPHEWPEGGRLL